VENRGISFGLVFPGLEIVSALVLLGVFYCWWRGREKGWWLVLLGGAANFWERILTGKVVDYWLIPGTRLYNNLNDYLIFIGLSLVVWEKWKRLK